jgi:hypothetical protein
MRPTPRTIALSALAIALWANADPAFAQVRIWLKPSGPGTLDANHDAPPPWFEGPTVARYTVAGNGFSGLVRGFGFTIRVLSGELDVADAWRFDNCMAGRASARFTYPDPRWHPLLGAHPTTMVTPSYTRIPDGRGAVDLGVAGFSDGIVTHPDSVYVLAELTLDLGIARIGPTTPDSCGCARQPLALELMEFGTWYSEPGQGGGMDAFGSGCTAWNMFGCPLHLIPQGEPCLEPTPALPATWGRLKERYR